MGLVLTSTVGASAAAGGISAGTALSAAAAGISAIGAISQGQAAKNQANFQAAVQQQQAARERQEAAAREEDFRRQQSRLMAARRAMGGASGVDFSTGSPLLSTEDFAGEIELNALRIRNQGDVNATRLEQSAQLQRMSGKNASRQGFFKAGASLLSGAGEIYKK